MLEVRSPFNYDLLKELKLDSIGDIKRKIEKAVNCFNTKKVDKSERILILEKTADLLRKKSEDFSLVIAKESGKPLKDSRIEVLRAIDGIKHAISELRVFSGTEIPMALSKSSINRQAFTVNEPKGLVIAISAFNHPLNLVIHQVVPAVLIGCPVIIKPDLRTPLSCINFVDLLYEAGLEKDWCQVSLCENYIAEELVKDKNNTFLNFIGSESVGWHLRSILPKGAACTLEHGGTAPVIIDESSNLDEAVLAVVRGGFYHSGQVCVSVQRVFVHESVLKVFSQKLVKKVELLKVGDPLSDETDLGPLIEPSQVDRVFSWVKESGGEVLTGGNKISEKEFEPTIILNPDLKSQLSVNEVFGPIVSLYSFSDFKKVIKQANDVDYAFQAAVFSNNHKNIMFAVNGLSANAVMVNDHTAFRVDWMPFGGYKKSGLGVGGFKSSLKDLTNEKLIVFNNN